MLAQRVKKKGVRTSARACRWMNLTRKHQMLTQGLLEAAFGIGAELGWTHISASRTSLVKRVVSQNIFLERGTGLGRRHSECIHSLHSFDV